MTSSATNVPAAPGPSERRTRLNRTAAYYTAFVGLGLCSAILGPTLPGLAAHTRATLPQISYLFTARSLGYLVGASGGGRLYDRVAGHRLMAASLLLLAAVTALVPTIPRLGLLIATLLLLGVAEGAVDVGGNTLLVWTHRAATGPFMNGLHFFFGMGAFLSPLIVARVVLASSDINWAFWAVALVYLPLVVWIGRLPSPRPLRASDAGAIGEAAPALVAMIAAFYFLYVGTEVSAAGWIYSYALARGLATVTTAAYLNSLFWGAFTAGRLLSIPLALRFTPPAMLLADLLGALGSLGAILLWPHSATALTIGAPALGLSLASVFPTMLALAGRHMTLTGRVNGLFFVGASLGGMFLPWLIGQLFGPIGPQVAIGLMLAALALALAVLGLLELYLARRTPRTGPRTAQ